MAARSHDRKKFHLPNPMAALQRGLSFCLPVLAVALLGLCASWARADVAATQPTSQDNNQASGPVVSDEAFAAALDLSGFKTLSVQHNQTIKTWDTMSRQMLSVITGKSSVEGQDPTYTILDMALRPQAYVGRNFIRVRVIPLRTDLGTVPGLSDQEKQRILEEGTISLAFWRDPKTVEQLAVIQATGSHKADAIDKVEQAASTMESLTLGGFGFPLVAMIPPATGHYGVWTRLDQIQGNVPLVREVSKVQGRSAPMPMADYTDESVSPVFIQALSLFKHWYARDAVAVQKDLDAMTVSLPAVNPAAYPSQLKRSAEVVYNRLFNLTLPGAALYFTAFAFFLMSLRSQSVSLRLWGLRFFFLALFIHTIAIAVRWWLLEKSTDDWFHSIPIRNQFESVMFSAWFGAVGLLLLEVWRGKSLYGTAGGFVGWLSLIAIFTVPFVLNISIGEQLGQVAGILMSYWLYVHVTLAVASYALIAATAFLGGLWLWTYYTSMSQIREVKNHRQLASETADLQMVAVGPGGVGARPGNGMWTTLARVMFIPVGRASELDTSTRDDPALEPSVVPRLRTIDQCNLTIMQLAFWVLGVAIVCGAVWADVSWGRPWGWDPKETFALVTWMCYLIIVHLRHATEYKAWWTAVLSIVGFIVMLFNWIGVNYFLVGLHSYA